MLHFPVVRFAALLFFCSSLLAVAQVTESAPPSPPPIPAEAVQVSDPAAATRSWLDTVPAEQRAKSDAYFEGGYWLILWNFLLGAAISLLLLQTRISARIRDWAERTSRFKALQVALYAIPYLLLTALLSFPMTAYQSFFREHIYGMATQTFGAWFGEQLKALAISLVGLSLLLIALYAIFRKTPRTWWIWGTGVALSFMLLGMLIAPVYIEPLFNSYKPITDPAISEPISGAGAREQHPRCPSV